MRSRGTGNSAVSRRLVAKTAAQLAAWQTAALDALDLVGLLLDGMHIASTVSSWRSASPPMAGNTRSGCGTARPRTRACVRTR